MKGLKRVQVFASVEATKMKSVRNTEVDVKILKGNENMKQKICIAVPPSELHLNPQVSFWISSENCCLKTLAVENLLEEHSNT